MSVVRRGLHQPASSVVKSARTRCQSYASRIEMIGGRCFG